MLAFELGMTSRLIRSGHTWPPVYMNLAPKNVLSMTIYSVADIITTPPPGSHHPLHRSHLTANKEKLCGYWSLSKTMFTPAPREVPTHARVNEWRFFLWVKTNPLNVIRLHHINLDFKNCGVFSPVSVLWGIHLDIGTEEVFTSV